MGMSSQKPQDIAKEIAEVRTRFVKAIDEIADRSQPNRIVDSQVQRVKAFYLDENGGIRIDRAGKTVLVILVLAILRKLFK
ncbi:MAG: hypothetical protein RIS09_172 [Actinomycetota bacterium]|jgi:hypothetical protein